MPGTGQPHWLPPKVSRGDCLEQPGHSWEYKGHLGRSCCCDRAQKKILQYSPSPARASLDFLQRVMGCAVTYSASSHQHHSLQKLAMQAHSSHSTQGKVAIPSACTAFPGEWCQSRGRHVMREGDEREGFAPRAQGEGGCSLFSKSRGAGGTANNLLSWEATLTLKELGVCYGLNCTPSK